MHYKSNLQHTIIIANTNSTTFHCYKAYVKKTSRSGNIKEWLKCTKTVDVIGNNSDGVGLILVVYRSCIIIAEQNKIEQ